MTMWEANSLGYKPYVEWFPEMKFWCGGLESLWLDVWTSSRNGNKPIIVELGE
jgi:hypothetical protein